METKKSDSTLEVPRKSISPLSGDTWDFMGPLRAITGERRAAETALQVLPFPAEKGR